MIGHTVSTGKGVPDSNVYNNEKLREETPNAKNYRGLTKKTMVNN